MGAIQSTISNFPFSFPLPVNFIYQDIEYKFMDRFSKLDEELATFRNSLPDEILDMTIGELKRLVSSIGLKRPLPFSSTNPDSLLLGFLHI